MYSSVYSQIRIDILFQQKASRYQVKSAFFDIFETLQVKSPRSETASGTHKTETFPIPRVLYVRMSRKEDIFDDMYPTKEDIVDDLHADDEDNT